MLKIDARRAGMRKLRERRQLACGVRQPAEHKFRRQAADECRLAACAPRTGRARCSRSL